ncbi:hypothetical protein pdam_00011443, partial [Pocillopora damicornis]
MRLSSAIKGLIYLKIPLVSKQTLRKVTSGNVIDLISTDVERIELAPRRIFISTFTILEIAAVTSLLFYLISWEAIRGALLSIVESLPFTLGAVATFLSVLALSLDGHLISPTTAFMLLAFINTLRITITRFFYAITSVFELWISLKRIRNFLLLKNISSMGLESTEKPPGHQD